MIEDRAPVAKENEITPIIIKTMQRSFSYSEIAVMSPYPTVKIVVVV
jgi:hypothetical protein